MSDIEFFIWAVVVPIGVAGLVALLLTKLVDPD